MAESEIVKLYENLSLADEDGAIHEMSEEDLQEGEVEVDLCLVGKILYEKPKGMGNISHMRFNKVELWIQIHDVPIICMNRRTSKWMAEQIGRVIDIPTESKDCWGKFMKVENPTDSIRDPKEATKFSHTNILARLSGSGSSQIHRLRLEGPSDEAKLSSKKSVEIGKEVSGPGLMVSNSTNNESGSALNKDGPNLERGPIEEMIMVVPSQPEEQTVQRSQTPEIGKDWRELRRHKLIRSISPVYFVICKWPTRNYDWAKLERSGYRESPSVLSLEEANETTFSKIYLSIGSKNLSNQIAVKNREIENLYKSCEKDGVMTVIKDLEKSVEEILDCEELFWKQRFKAEWLEARDRNSKFFHARASARKKKNSIHMLYNNEGRIEDTNEGMAIVIQEYFHSIF
ncbi:hypothetical protein EZV62_023490 [Acer yangbiense]|uniref:Uncharacterized protein n=1 Tax=Acer yangbiense TaxID=1000413 RepID=A0A5C7H3X8_9ROSI|nr:hypothetical protein EZV62_023490 [Acer yangbiense]